MIQGPERACVRAVHLRQPPFFPVSWGDMFTISFVFDRKVGIMTAKQSPGLSPTEGSQGGTGGGRPPGTGTQALLGGCSATVPTSGAQGGGRTGTSRSSWAHMSLAHAQFPARTSPHRHGRGRFLTAGQRVAEMLGFFLLWESNPHSLLQGSFP